MAWTWDTTQITHDQTCWTYDGFNGCVGGASAAFRFLWIAYGTYGVVGLYSLLCFTTGNAII